MSRFKPFLITLVVLSACTVGPDYEKPDMQAPPEFVSQEVLDILNNDNKDEAFAPDWWMGFKDPVLDELVLNGLKNNFEIASAAAEVREAKARIKLAGAGDNLSADATVDGSTQERQNLDNGESTTTLDVDGGIGVDLPLDVLGRTRRDVEAARAGLESANAQLNAVILRVSTDIASEYLTLCGNQRQLELLRESVALQEKTLSIVKSRYESGLSPELDLRRAETSVENFRADIPPLERDLLNSRNRLATLTGEYAGTYEELLSPFKSLPNYKSPISKLMPLDVLRKRPDIQQAEADLKQAVANIGVAEADFYPTFQLSGQINIGASAVSSLPTVETLVASIAAMIAQTITDGGAHDANLEIAQAQAEQALADYEQALREASEEVETSLAAIQSSLKRQGSLEKAVSSSQRSFSQAETLYQQGLISFLDVVDAQRVLASAKQQLARERTNYATQIATLFRALGTDIQTREE